MKKILLLIFLVFSIYSSAQTITTTTITDWNNLKKSGFYESATSNTSNLPGNNLAWYWGINIAHSVNANVADKPYYYGGQILFGVNSTETGLPLMYIRSTNADGKGAWAKVLTDNGAQTTNGALNINTLNCNDLSANTLKSVLARLPEGNNEGEGTYLGVKSYDSQINTEQSYYNVKSFSIEHKFYGRLNNRINFYRGGSTIGGRIGIDVYDGRQIANFHVDGFDVAGTIKAREIKVEINAGADHVFNPNYNLKSLSELETFVKENKHLPEILSEKQMQEEGLNINEFQIKLLQKIEELTLYVIEQDKTIKAQSSLLNKQGKLIENLQDRFEATK